MIVWEFPCESRTLPGIYTQAPIVFNTIGAFYVQDVRYAAGAGMRKSGAVAQRDEMPKQTTGPRAQGCARAALYRMYLCRVGQEVRERRGSAAG